MLFITPELISKYLGSSSGLLGILIGITTGAVSLLPAFIAFPLGATILDHGAGITQVAGFISALMGIGILTFSMEKKFFGLRFAVLRNTSSLLATILFVAAIALIGG